MEGITKVSILNILVCFIFLPGPSLLETERSPGVTLDLSEEEISMNFLLKQLKPPVTANISTNVNVTLIGYRKYIETSKLFQLIQKMPKGANLDGHLFGLISFEFLYNLTFASDLYIRYVEDGVEFSYGNYNLSDDNWYHLNTLRRNTSITESFIKEKLLFNLADLSNYTTYTVGLKRLLHTVKTLLSKKSVLKAAIYQMLKDHYEDNVSYVEFRYSLDFFDTKKAKSYESLKILKYCYRIIENFKLSNPKFFDAKIIYSPVNITDFDHNLKNLLQLNQHVPNVLIGFDVMAVGNVSQILIDLKLIPYDIQVFLHFDEDISFKPKLNLNLLSGAVNRPSRYMYNNKLLADAVFSKHVNGLGVGINICPSCVWKSDLHWQKSTRFIEERFRIITSSEYPGFWQVKGLSYDWFLMYVVMANGMADVAFLKQMAKNSIIYSSLQSIDSMMLMTQWNDAWTEFVKTLYGNSAKTPKINIRQELRVNISHQQLSQQIIRLRINN